jgi:phosphate transport system substrate-binding protein
MKTLLKKASVLALGLHLMASFAGAEGLLINGAGATFPYPIYSKWFDEYHKLKPEFKFNYQSIGSGGGIRQISAKTVDFGATDGPMTDAQLESAPGFLMHVPTVLGAVVVSYNLEGVNQPLNFSPESLAGIFLGDIKTWNDPKLQKDNPGVQLPAQPITVVRRSDGSGTTYIFVDYLSKVSNAWATKVGKGTSVAWPIGIGGKGNEGVAGLIKQTPNSIGYIEMIYAKQNKLSVGLVKNKAGKFIEPSVASVSAAAKAKIPSDFRASITNSPDAAAYPISGFTWLLVYQKQSDAQKGKALVDFLNWMLTDGQKFASDLGYAPLPDEVNALVKKSLTKIKY